MGHSGPGQTDDTIIYSVMVRKGPDTAHYDMVFDEDALILRYLGEYWEKGKPLRGLQRSMDLLIYRMNKRKNRKRDNSSVYDVVIDYCSIKSYELRGPGKRLRRRRLGKRVVDEAETLKPRLKIRTVDGGEIEITFSAKVYELVKRLVRRRLEPSIRRCMRQSKQ